MHTLVERSCQATALKQPQYKRDWISHAIHQELKCVSGFMNARDRLWAGAQWLGAGDRPAEARASESSHTPSHGYSLTSTT